MRSHLRIVSGFLLFVLAAVEVFSTQAGAQQRGPSTPEERARAVQTAKSLQSDPLAPHVQEDREWLVKWLIEVPDISVKMCTTFLGDLGDSKSGNPGAIIRFDANISEGGGVTEVSGIANGNKSADNPTGQNINVTFKPDAAGDAGLVAHEGSHVADASAWVASGFSANMNPTNLTTELNAFHVQFNVINALGPINVPRGMVFGGAQLNFKNGPLKWNAGDTFKQVTPDLQQKLKENYKNLDSPAFRKGAVLQP
jgi:hypothetical protein